MRLTVIGCYGGSPKVNEACSGYLLEAEGEKLLLDCGAGVLSVLQNVTELTELHHIILSHYHYDHFSDAGSAIYSRLVNMRIGSTSEKLHFYAPKDDIYFQTLAEEPYSDVQEIDGEKNYQIGPFRVCFCKTEHPIECYAMRVEAEGKTIVYTADTAYFPELARFAQNADVLIAECSLYAGVSGARAGHMNCAEVAQLAHEAQAKCLIYTHLPIYGKHQELQAEIEKTYGGIIMRAEKLLKMDVI